MRVWSRRRVGQLLNLEAPAVIIINLEIHSQKAGGRTRGSPYLVGKLVLTANLMHFEAVFGTPIWGPTNSFEPGEAASMDKSNLLQA